MNENTRLRRSFSAYWFALVLTVMLCTLLSGIIYIDCCASDTILSAEGVISPLFNKIIDAAERSLRS